jgi:hypothetical protein
MERPLELRFDDVELRTIAVSAAWERGDARVRAELRHVDELRERPDLGALDWSQLRFALGVTLALGTGAPRIPDAVLRIPRAGGAP